MIACDTSALAKFYLNERDAPSVRKLLESADQVCISELGRVELVAVFHRRLREGTFSRREFTATVRQFQHDDLSGYWSWLPVDPEILQAAAQTFTTLASSVFLRSSDCIHLVTAVHHRFQDFLTFDAHQAIAASALGLRAIG